MHPLTAGISADSFRCCRCFYSIFLSASASAAVVLYLVIVLLLLISVCFCCFSLLLLLLLSPLLHVAMQAAQVLSLRPLADYCQGRLGQMAHGVKIHRYEDVVAANVSGEMWLILDSMVRVNCVSHCASFPSIWHVALCLASGALRLHSLHPPLHSVH